MKSSIVLFGDHYWFSTQNSPHVVPQGNVHRVPHHSDNSSLCLVTIHNSATRWFCVMTDKQVHFKKVEKSCSFCKAKQPHLIINPAVYYFSTLDVIVKSNDRGHSVLICTVCVSMYYSEYSLHIKLPFQVHMICKHTIHKEQYIAIWPRNSDWQIGQTVAMLYYLYFHACQRHYKIKWPMQWDSAAFSKKKKNVTTQRWIFRWYDVVKHCSVF